MLLEWELELGLELELERAMVTDVAERNLEASG